jgi:hypothetical protein
MKQQNFDQQTNLIAHLIVESSAAGKANVGQMGMAF